MQILTVNFFLLAVSDNVCLTAAVKSRAVLYAHAPAYNKSTMHFFQRKSLFSGRLVVTGQDLTGPFLWHNLIDLKSPNWAGQLPVVFFSWSLV